MARWQGIDPRVRLVDISRGAALEIDLAKFPVAARFGYVDDYQGSVEVLANLELDGTATLEGQPDFMWLSGPRRCVMMRATGGTTAAFRALTVGEFCIEVYYVRPDGSAELLHQNDFCFK